MLLYQNIFSTILPTSSTVTTAINEHSDVQVKAVTGAMPAVTEEKSILRLDSLLKSDVIQPKDGTNAAVKTAQSAVTHIRPAISRQPGDVVVRPSAPEVVPIDKDNSKVNKVKVDTTAVAVIDTSSDSKHTKYLLTHSLTD